MTNLDTVVDKLVEKIGIAVEKIGIAVEHVTPIAQEVLEQYQTRTGVYLIAGMVFFCIGLVLLIQAYRSPNESYRCCGEISPAKLVLFVTGVMFTLWALISIIENLGVYLAPLPSMLGI